MIITVLAADSLSMTSLLPRLFISMAVVIGLMWLAARFFARRNGAGPSVRRSGGRRNSASKQGPQLQIIAKQGMGGKSSVAIIKAGGKELVVGITEHNISLLTELNAVDVCDAADSLTANAKTRALLGDIEPKQLERQGTGALRTTATAVPSSTTRKGLLESVRDMTVRK